MKTRTFLVLGLGAMTMLGACFPLGQVKDQRRDPGDKSPPYPTCTPRESPACVGQ